MKNLSFIVDADGQRRSVILSLDDYSEVYNLAVRVATHALLRPCSLHLNMPELAIMAVHSLMGASGGRWKEFQTTDDEIVKMIPESLATFKRYKKDLESFMKLSHWRIVDINQIKPPKRIQSGTNYRLNLPLAISEGIRKSQPEESCNFRLLRELGEKCINANLKELKQQGFESVIDPIVSEIKGLSGRPSIFKAPGPKASSGRM